MVRMLRGLMLVTALMLCFGGIAAADDFHYSNLLVGERASGMGGAYTAVSDDVTGMYYNPAGIVYATGKSLSASVNAYNTTDKTYNGAIGSNGWKRTSSSLLPNYFGAVVPIGTFKVGFSYAVPDSIMEDQAQWFSNLPISGGTGTISTYIINFNNESNIYNFGPTIAKDITDSFSMGFTLYYYKRDTKWILNQIIHTENGGYELTNQYYHTNEWGWRPILGAMWSPVKSLSFGLAVSRILVSNTETNYQVSQDRQNVPGFVDTILLPDMVSPDQRDIHGRRKYPYQISFGTAWFPSPRFLLTADIDYFTNVSGVNPQLQSTIKQVTNAALGTEFYVTRNWAMRAGFYTNFANTPKIETGRNQQEHIDIYGGTASIGYFTRNTSITLGTGFTYGKGKAQIVGDSFRTQDVKTKGQMIFLSSSYSY